MDTEQLQVPLDGIDGAYVIFEVDPADLEDGSVQLVADDGSRLNKATSTLTEAFSRVEPAIEVIVSRLRNAAPDEITVDFGLKMGGEAGLIWAKGTAEANIAVSVTWKRGAARDSRDDKGDTPPESGDARRTE